MKYVSIILLPSQEMESRHFTSTSPTYYTTLYPFQIFPQKGIKFIEFSEITILCGGNGSGKSTLLNVISEKIGLNRDSQFNKTELFDKCAELKCRNEELTEKLNRIKSALEIEENKQ